MEKRLECIEDGAAKFWDIKVTGSKTAISFGKIGTAGRAQTKDHGTAAAAEKYADKIIKEKEKKGYAESRSGTKRDAPAAAASAKGGARKGRSAGSHSSKRRQEEEKEDCDDAEALPEKEVTKRQRKTKEEEVAECKEEEDGQRKWPEPVLGLGGPVLWRACIQPGASSGPVPMYAIYIDDKSVYAGNEEGIILDLTHDGKLKRSFNLPVGAKCIVGDGPFLYVGCNNGTLYDLTSGVPRLMCKIDVFTQVLWMDIRHGMLAVSDENGGVALVNGEGETMWSKKPEKVSSGWMCRMDEKGIYHGTTDGVTKYDLAGNVLWRQLDPRIRGIVFGCQDAEHIYPAAMDYVAKIDKKTGEIKHLFAAQYPSSNAVSADGKYVIPSSPFVCYNGNTGNFAWKFPHGAGFSSMVFHGTDRLFGVNNSIVCYDLSPAAISKAESGRQKLPDEKRYVISKAIEVSESVETTGDASKGFLCECKMEDGKLRVHVKHQGYNLAWNVQFPQAIREAGAKYIVEQIVESKQGGFYRALGDIKKFAN